jgi:hypothetical protein
MPQAGETPLGKEKRMFEVRMAFMFGIITGLILSATIAVMVCFVYLGRAFDSITRTLNQR